MPLWTCFCNQFTNGPLPFLYCRNSCYTIAEKSTASICNKTGHWFVLPVPSRNKTNFIQLAFKCGNIFWWFLPGAGLFQWRIVPQVNQNCQTPLGAVR